MKKITLIFPSIEKLWDFVLQSKLSFVEINLPKLILICSCSETDIANAIQNFNATHLETVDKF
jgi:hypothetical protein